MNTAVLPVELALPERWSDGAPNTGRYVAVVGSWSYGMVTADSDVDLRGMYMCAPEELLGLGRPGEVWSSADVTLHEAARYCELALGANPTALESLASELVIETCPFAEALRANRSALYSARVQRSYTGFASQQIDTLSRMNPLLVAGVDRRTSRTVRHLFRFLEQCERLLTTGELTLAVADPDALRAYDDIDLDTIVAHARAEVARIRALDTDLPEDPDNEFVGDLLRDHRLAQLGVPTHPSNRNPGQLLDTARATGTVTTMTEHR